MMFRRHTVTCKVPSLTTTITSFICMTLTDNSPMRNEMLGFIKPFLSRGQQLRKSIETKKVLT